MINLKWEYYQEVLNVVTETEYSAQALKALETRCHRLATESTVVLELFGLYLMASQKVKELGQDPQESSRTWVDQFIKATVALSKIQGALAMLVTLLESDKTIEADQLKLRLQAIREIVKFSHDKGFIEFHSPLEAQALDEMFTGQRAPLLPDLLAQVAIEAKQTKSSG